MAPSARISAHPHVGLKYWTAQPRDQRHIKEWIDEELDDHLTIYACFINWCAGQVDKLKNPSAKYPTNADKVRGEKVRPVLRQEPLDVREFIGLMESYFEREWRLGIRTGPIGQPHKASKSSRNTLARQTFH
jgi:hypothetical protein